MQKHHDKDGHEPEADAGGYAAAYAAHLGQPETAVYEDVVAGYVQKKAEKAYHHGRPGQAEALKEGPDVDKEEKAGKPWQKCLKIAFADPFHVAFKAEHGKMAGQVPEKQDKHRADGA